MYFVVTRGRSFAGPGVACGRVALALTSTLSFSLLGHRARSWMEQHTRLEKLNLQSHQCALSNSDDFVLEALVSFDKMSVIVHELLAIELWREHVYPKVHRSTRCLSFLVYSTT